ncbi:hypothetical protein C3I27_03750 [Campylobacter jejuni]|uniref:Uncharacterized protein n=1 Tax=Campylobacter jejuni TaxID=197 RepID=A0AAX1Z4Z1_CAMJU|nr:hypothetical protein C3I27_03750 [Campylobacter jejuni]
MNTLRKLKQERLLWIVILIINLGFITFNLTFGRLDFLISVVVSLFSLWCIYLRCSDIRHYKKILQRGEELAN